jgi:type 1 fimbriae regulatory protein FimB
MNRMLPLTRAELLAVLKAARQESLRDHAMLLLCYAHGMRASEAAQLMLSDIDMGRLTVRVNRRKGSLKTEDKLSPNSERLLDEVKTLTGWLERRPADSGPYLFPSRKNGALSRIQVYRLFRQYYEKAGVAASKRGPHALKHTLGQRMHDLGVDVKIMRQALGHKSITSTMAYFDVTPEQADRARQAALMSRL